MDGINVLSLCDGMSCAKMALDEAGIKVNSYFASEIKEIAISFSKSIFSDITHIGDVKKIKYENGILYTELGIFKVKIDFVVFGSPCQSFSRAMPYDKRIGLKDGNKSGLFYECYRILKEVNPKYFLMENTNMGVIDRNTITNLLGVSPIRINSSLFTGALRDRLYWTNICDIESPLDKGIALSDIIENGYTPFKKARCLMRNDSHGYYNGGGITPIKRFYRSYYKCFSTIIFPNEDYFNNCLKICTDILSGKSAQAYLFDEYTGNDFNEIRYLTKIERARLQGVPEIYMKNVSERDAADLLGDGMTVPVIAHIIKNMN